MPSRSSFLIYSKICYFPPSLFFSYLFISFFRKLQLKKNLIFITEATFNRIWFFNEVTRSCLTGAPFIHIFVAASPRALPAKTRLDVEEMIPTSQTDYIYNYKYSNVPIVSLSINLSNRTYVYTDMQTYVYICTKRTYMHSCNQIVRLQF